MMPSLQKRRCFRLLALTLAFGLLWPDLTWVFSSHLGKAYAEEQRRLALFVVPKTKQDNTTALLFRGLLRQAADRLAPFGLKRADTSPPEDMGALNEVFLRVEQGMKALSESKWADAYQSFALAEQLLKKCLGVADRALVARVYKGLGVALASMNRVEEARKAIARSLTVYPNQVASAYAYSLEARNLFSAVQREIEDLPTGSIEVTTEPEDAEVYVDYGFRGFSPIKVSGLEAGDHLITIFSDGRVLYSAFHTVKGGAEEKITIPLEPSGQADKLTEQLNNAFRAVVSGKGESQAGAALGALTNASDVFYVVVSTVPKGQAFTLSGFYWNAASGAVKVHESIAKDENLVSNIQGLLARSLGFSEVPQEAALEPLDAPKEEVQAKAATSVPVAEGEEYIIDPNSPIFKDTTKKPKESGIVSKWWFWTAIGAVVGGAVATGVLLGTRSSGAGTPEGEIRINLHGAQ